MVSPLETLLELGQRELVLREVRGKGLNDALPLDGEGWIAIR
ncbi:MAG: hypothetical protein ABR499_19730 [Gemmatimonadaceae bacterium]